MGGDWAEPKKEVGFRFFTLSVGIGKLSQRGMQGSSSELLHNETPVCETCTLLFTAAQVSNLFWESQILQSTKDLFLCTVAPKRPNSRDLLTGGRVASLI